MRIRPTISDSGMTLIELLIALAISFVGAVAVFALFLGQSRSMRESQETMEMQDNIRAALDMVARDLRSAGFMTTTTEAVRVENNCGGAVTGGGTYSGLDVATGVFTAPGGGGTAITDEGDVEGTTQLDGCPNGSDRLAIVFRPRTDYVPNVLPAVNPQDVKWGCPAGDCAAIFARAGVTGTTCGTSNDPSDPMTICAANDPYRCFPATITPMGAGCACTGDADEVCELEVRTLAGAAFDGGQGEAPGWDHLCPTAGVACTPDEAKPATAFQAYASRTYQLLDVDSDGSTELVVSPDQLPLVSRPGAPADATYEIVASYIDDFQLAIAFRNTPDVFQDLSLWNVPGCTEDGDNACIAARVTANNPPVAIRVSLVARTSKRRVGETSAVADLRRGQVHDNNPTFQAMPAGAPVVPVGPALCYGSEVCGCGPSDTLSAYMKCSLRGNAQGYQRRVISEVIGLRNLSTR